jgi:hypothetical protein
MSASRRSAVVMSACRVGDDFWRLISRSRDRRSLSSAFNSAATNLASYARCASSLRMKLFCPRGHPLAVASGAIVSRIRSCGSIRWTQVSGRVWLLRVHRSGLPDMDMASDKWREDILPIIERSKYRHQLPQKGSGSKGDWFSRFNSVTALL